MEPAGYAISPEMGFKARLLWELEVIPNTVCKIRLFSLDFVGFLMLFGGAAIEETVFLSENSENFESELICNLDSFSGRMGFEGFFMSFKFKVFEIFAIRSLIKFIRICNN